MYFIVATYPLEVAFCGASFFECVYYYFFLTYYCSKQYSVWWHAHESCEWKMALYFCYPYMCSYVCILLNHLLTARICPPTKIPHYLCANYVPRFFPFLSLIWRIFSLYFFYLNFFFSLLQVLFEFKIISAYTFVVYFCKSLPRIMRFHVYSF